MFTSTNGSYLAGSLFEMMLMSFSNEVFFPKCHFRTTNELLIIADDDDDEKRMINREIVSERENFDQIQIRICMCFTYSVFGPGVQDLTNRPAPRACIFFVVIVRSFK